jgi:hypothetical protein
LVATLLTISFGITSAGDAWAKKKKKKKPTSDEPAEVTEPQKSDAIAGYIEGVTWGMSPDAVIEVIKGQVREFYKAQAAELNDSIKEDKIFNKMEKELKKVEDSYYEFKGTPKWDSSVVQDEYTHKNGEAMIFYRHERWTDYYFFIASPDYNPSATSKDPLYEQNKMVLWKLYRAFDASMFPGLTWADVRSILGQEFGDAPYKVKKFDPDTKFVNVVEVRWQDDHTLLSLVDQMTFFGIFCLRFEDKYIGKQIDKLRVNKSAKDKDGHAIVDGLSDGTGKDSESNIVDVLTGKGHGDKGSSVK